MLKNSTGKQAGESVQPTPYESILRQEGRAIHSEDSSVDPDRIPVFLSGVSTSERKQPGVSANGALQLNKVKKTNLLSQQNSFNFYYIEGESLENLSIDQIVKSAKELLHKCNQACQDLDMAVQEFDMYDQFFTSACGRKYDLQNDTIAPTYKLVKKAGSEMFIPQSAYTVSVTKYRVFLANLLLRLPDHDPTRKTITANFNELSRQYEDREKAVRHAINNIHNKKDSDVRMRMGYYMKAFKQRGELLKWQQKTLETWVEEALVELVNTS